MINISAGLNDGVTKHIGMALNYERNSGVKKGPRVVAVGIAPWGLVEHRDELIVRNKDRIYNPLEHTQSKFRVLNPKHNNFLLVDNGSAGKVGGRCTDCHTYGRITVSHISHSRYIRHFKSLNTFIIFRRNLFQTKIRKMYFSSPSVWSTIRT